MQAHARFMLRLVAPLLFAFALPGHAQSIAEHLNSGRIDVLRSQVGDVQRTAALNTIVGRSDLNSDLHGLSRTPLKPPSGTQLVEGGSNWILDAARDRRVVMFNENHYEPQARVFVRSLLPMLRRAGFTHIGFEAFLPAKDPGAYEPFNSHYTVEPMFSALIREAKRLGFVVFGYEATRFADQNASMQEAVETREQSEAENLAAAIYSFPNSAKVVIFAGWSHIAEQALEDGFGPKKTKWMAARFAEATHIDPLTVDLTSCAFEVDGPGNHDAQVHVASGETALLPESYVGAVDAHVCLPVAGKSYPNRASFFRSTLGQPVRIPESLERPNDEVLVQAFEGHRTERSVAYDRVLVRPGEQLQLYLPPGSYELMATLPDGMLVGRAVLVMSDEGRQ